MVEGGEPRVGEGQRAQLGVAGVEARQLRRRLDIVQVELAHLRGRARPALLGELRLHTQKSPEILRNATRSHRNGTADPAVPTDAARS